MFFVFLVSGRIINLIKTCAMNTKYIIDELKRNKGVFNELLKENVSLGHVQLFWWLNAQHITKNKHYSYEHDHMCLESKLKQMYVSST